LSQIVLKLGLFQIFVTFSGYAKAGSRCFWLLTASRQKSVLVLVARAAGIAHGISGHSLEERKEKASIPFDAVLGQDAVATRGRAKRRLRRGLVWRPEMSQKRQPEESDIPRRGGGSESGESSSSLPHRPGETKRQRVPALRE
jgi:hypothetical protein